MSIILPTRRIVSPRYGEVEVDWSNPVNRGLLLFGLMTGNRPVDLVSNRPATVDHAHSSAVNTRRGPAFQATETSVGSGPLQFGVIPVVGAVTVLFHYHNTSGELHSAPVFGDSVGDTQLNAYMPFNDGTLYWDFGSDATGRTTASGLTYGNDVWVLTAGGGAMGIWQNGISRTATTGHTARTSHPSNPMGVMKYNGGGGNTRQGNSQVFAIWNRVLTTAEIAQVSRDYWTGLKVRRPRRMYFIPAPTGGGVTAVGASFSPTWNVLSRVGQSAAPAWSVRTSLGQTVAPTWSVRAVIGQTTAPSWNVRSVIGQTTAPSWNVRSVIGQTKAPAWSVRTFLGQTVAPSWNVRSVIGQTKAPAWSVRTFLGQTVAPSWNVRALAGQSQALAWDTQSTTLTAGASIGPTWNVRARSGQVFSSSWNVSISAAKAASVAWSVRNAIGKTAATAWIVRGGVVQVVGPVWNVRALAGRACGLSWNVGGPAAGLPTLLVEMGGARSAAPQGPSLSLETTAQPSLSLD